MKTQLSQIGINDKNDKLGGPQGAPFASERRRLLLGLAALAGGALLPLQVCGALPVAPRLDLWRALAQPTNRDIQGPFREIQAFSGLDYQGDEMTHPHEALWDTAGFLRRLGGAAGAVDAGVYDLIVIGGGLSGFFAVENAVQHWWDSQRLKSSEQRPSGRPPRILLLEQATQVGGNAIGESYSGQRFGLGSAYITKPDPQSDWGQLLSRLGLIGELRVEAAADMKTFDLSKQSLGNRLEEWFATRLLGQAQRATDDVSALEWLQGLKPSTADLEFLQLYGWSSFGASLEEISAEQFAGFLAPEISIGVGAWPGGNARLLESLMADLLARQEDVDLTVKTGALAVEVRNVSSASAASVQVLWSQNEDPNRINPVLHRGLSSAVIVAAPKFVATRIVPEASPLQLREWRSIGYRAYVTANLLLDQKISSRGMDLYVRQGSVPDAPSFGQRTDRDLVDVVFSDWANADQSAQTILTAYRPFPFDGARQHLASSVGFERLSKGIRKSVDELLEKLGETARVSEVRLARFGHALPVARVGGLDRKAVRVRSQPVGRIHFSNQDDLLNPSVESAWESSRRVAQELRL
jgi:hypothetical protein